MTRTAILAAAIAASLSPLFAQERPVPKDSTRLLISGCARGRVFTVHHDPSHESRGYRLEEGMKLRLEGPKQVLNDIKSHESSMIEITGLMKQSEVVQPGVGVAGGRIRITPVMPNRPGASRDPGPSTPVIDVESYQQLNTSCPSR
jgi:hypothetical protein